MPSGLKTEVIVPFFNERKCFGNSRKTGFFKALKNWTAEDSANRSVVFVNDGSKDGGEDHVMREGFQIINSHPSGQNAGKGAALIAGFRHAHGKGAEVAVTIDADVVNLTPGRINGLVESLQHVFPSGCKSNMAIGRKIEGGMVAIPSLNGERAIRLAALHPLFKGGRKAEKIEALMQQFGAETALNHLLSHDVPGVWFESLKAYRKGRIHQQEQINSTDAMLSERGQLAKRLWELKRRALGRGIPRGKVAGRIAEILGKERRNKPHLR
ncbi:glycosyltransferase [Candidatus Micrarchaeota archaeon]|nr:glycosyltransferase [Candidatus Micrarchaeota archaeon]